MKMDGIHCKVSETIEHCLLQCKKYERERRIMQRRLKYNTLDLVKLFGNFSDFRVLLDYIKATNRFEMFI